VNNLISPEYQAQITKLHQSRPWGGAVKGSGQMLHKYLILTKSKSILDYGAGRSDLKKELDSSYPDHPYIINEYEPGIPELAGDPPVSDAVISFDVMEHVETDKVEGVIEHIYNKTNLWTYHKICLKPATSVFPGTKQNLHVTIKPGFWWLEKFSKHFEFLETGINAGYVYFLGVKK
tara:strand:- start:44 stop:574 length:531 start_codon:yes stop_codon:yes gene_type:complete